MTRISPEKDEPHRLESTAEPRRESGGVPGPVVPRPASTVVVVRERGGGPEVLLLLRPRSGFAGGAWVFPGGIVDGEDFRLVGAVTEVHWARARRMELEDAVEAASYVVAGVRETWEETGLLLGRTPVEAEEVRTVRRRLLANETTFAEAVRTLRFEPAFESLVYLARWVTPPTQPRRYDTRFFLAEVPVDAPATLEGGELLEAAWLAPGEALRRWETRDMSMLFPTVHTLRRLAPFSSVADLLREMREAPVTTYLPQAEPPDQRPVQRLDP